MSGKRLSTGIKGLDEMTHGGYIPGDAVLIAGSPGTGKTTTAMHFMAAGVEAGEHTVFVTFEYLPQQIYRDAGNRGWPLEQWEKEGKVKVICTTPDVLMMEADQGQSLLEEAIQEVNAKRLIVDSMTHFEFLGSSHNDLRQDLSGLMNRLRLLDVTTVVTHEIPQIIGPAVRISNWGLEFLVDAVILLRYVELEGELQKAINILKFRGSDHDKRYRRLRLDQGGVTVEEEFAGVENISGGTATRKIAARAEELI